jgi:hypothetical protein
MPTAAAASSGWRTRRPPRADPALDRRSELEWEVSLTKDSVDRDHPQFNMKSARSKLMSKPGAQTGKFASARRAAGGPRPQGRGDGLLHLPPVLDDELRRLPPADRGELENGQPQI